MLKKIFIPKKLCTKELCEIGLLIAVTVVLGYASGYLRIGSFGKFSIGFVSVFVAGAMFGPYIGGFVGGVADVVSFAVNPVGAFLWQITLCEVLFGFIYGAFFYTKDKTIKRASYWVRIVICVMISLVANLFIKTAALQSAGLMPNDFAVAFSMRAPICFITAAFQILVFALFYKYINKLIKR